MRNSSKVLLLIGFATAAAVVALLLARGLPVAIVFHTIVYERDLPDELELSGPGRLAAVVTARAMPRLLDRYGIEIGDAAVAARLGLTDEAIDAQREQLHRLREALSVVADGTATPQEAFVNFELADHGIDELRWAAMLALPTPQLLAGLPPYLDRERDEVRREVMAAAASLVSATAETYRLEAVRRAVCREHSASGTTCSIVADRELGRYLGKHVRVLDRQYSGYERHVPFLNARSADFWP